MGWCHEFGPQIAETCDHPMTAGATSCSCEICGTVCTGRFAGCSAVWARGPREVAVNAPHLGKFENGQLDLTASANGETNGDSGTGRWRLPLEPMMKVGGTRILHAETVTGLIEDDEPEAASEDAADEPLTFEAPDVTARFAVAQLEELNERMAELTELATEKTEATLAKVHQELRRITALREVDLTEQAAGIFTAVQSGAEALDAFATVVDAVTTDLRTILADALTSIGGTEGLAAWVAESAADLAETREEFAASLARIERDLTLMRRRQTSGSQAVPAPATTEVEYKLNDDQLTFIVEAVTESVVSALTTEPSRASRKR